MKPIGPVVAEKMRHNIKRTQNELGRLIFCTMIENLKRILPAEFELSGPFPGLIRAKKPGAEFAKTTVFRFSKFAPPYLTGKLPYPQSVLVKFVA